MGIDFKINIQSEINWTSSYMIEISCSFLVINCLIIRNAINDTYDILLYHILWPLLHFVASIRRRSAWVVPGDNDDVMLLSWPHKSRVRDVTSGCDLQYGWYTLDVRWIYVVTVISIKYIMLLHSGDTSCNCQEIWSFRVWKYAIVFHPRKVYVTEEKLTV